MTLLSLYNYQPKKGDYIVKVGENGVPYLQKLRTVKGPYVNVLGESRIEYTTEEFQFKVNQPAKEVAILQTT